MYLLVDLAVAEIDDQIQADREEIEEIDDQHIVDLSGDDLGGDAADIAEDDQQDERQAHAVRRARAVIVDKRDRPRKAKADEHHRLKHILHFKCLPGLFSRLS